MSLVRTPARTEKKIAAHQGNGSLSPSPPTAEGKERRRVAHTWLAKSVDVFGRVIGQISMSTRTILALPMDSADVEPGTTQPARDVACYQGLREVQRGIRQKKDVKKNPFEAGMYMKTIESRTECPTRKRTFSAICHAFYRM